MRARRGVIVSALAKANGSWSIAPASMGELMQFARLVADSELVPKDYRNKPGNVVIAIQMGSDVGLSPMQAIQAIAVINGRATLWGDTMLAVVQASPLCVDVVEMSEADIRKQGFAKCTAKRQGREDKTSTFSIEDAKTAGLWGKQGPWTTAPARMLKMRARAFALRDQFPDVLRGIASAEEQVDIIEARVVSMDTPTPPPAAPSAPKQLPAPKPLPTKTSKNYSVKEYAEVPFTSLPIAALTAYVAYYEERLPGIEQANHRAGVEATLEAARSELNEHRKLEAEAAGADPETGEVPVDPGEYEAQRAEDVEEHARERMAGLQPGDHA